MPQQIPENPEIIVRPQQAARHLGISQETLRLWSRDGLVPSIRLHNGHRRYRIADLDAYLAQHAEVNR